MTVFVCEACGTHYPDAAAPPSACPICEDERQFVGWSGQRWTTPAALAAAHRPDWSEEGGVAGIGLAPHFAIGQRALLVPDGERMLLWDCVPLLTSDIVARVRAMGGLSGIAISHPHYYSAMGAWSDAFGGVPIHLHADDARWIVNPHPALRLWSGETLALSRALTLVRCGGHFEGGAVLHRQDDEGGTLFAADIVQVAMDRRFVSFMRSYPNMIPLDAAAVRRIGAALAGRPVERIYGAFKDRNVMRDGRAALDRSIARYLAAIGAAPAPIG